MDKRHILGVDIGTSTIKALAATVLDGSIVIQGSGMAPTAGYSKGTVVDPVSLAAAIREAVECVGMVADFPVNSVLLGLGGNALQSLNAVGSIAPVSPRAISQEDINRACRAAVLTAIPDDQCVLHALPASFWVDNHQFSGSPLEQPGNRLDVETHIVTVPKKLVDDIRTALTAIGISIVGVVANTIVGAQGLAMNSTEHSCLVLDIGAGTTDVVICRQDHVRLSASLPIGGDYITSDIMQGLGITRPHAEEVKRYYCRLDKSLLGSNVTLNCDYEQQSLQVPYDFLHKIIESRVEEILSLGYEYVGQALEKYDVGEIFLTGGCAVMPSMQQCAQQLFNRPVSVGQIAQLPSEYASPDNMASYGLLVYGAQCVPAQLDQAASSWRSLLTNLANYFRPSR